MLSHLPTPTPANMPTLVLTSRAQLCCHGLHLASPFPAAPLEPRVAQERVFLGNTMLSVPQIQFPFPSGHIVWLRFLASPAVKRGYGLSSGQWEVANEMSTHVLAWSDP